MKKIIAGMLSVFIFVAGINILGMNNSNDQSGNIVYLMNDVATDPEPE